MNTETSDLACKIFKEQADFIGCLKERWADEFEYENFDEYVDEMKKRINSYEGAEFIKFTKRPFAVTFCISEYKFIIAVKRNCVTLNLLK